MKNVNYYGHLYLTLLYHHLNSNEISYVFYRISSFFWRYTIFVYFHSPGGRLFNLVKVWIFLRRRHTKTRGGVDSIDTGR